MSAEINLTQDLSTLCAQISRCSEKSYLFCFSESPFLKKDFHEVINRIFQNIHSKNYTGSHAEPSWQKVVGHCRDFSSYWKLIKFIPEKKYPKKMLIEKNHIQRTEALKKEECQRELGELFGGLLCLIFPPLLTFPLALAGLLPWQPFAVFFTLIFGPYITFSLLAERQYVLYSKYPLSHLDQEYKITMQSFIRKLLEIMDNTPNKTRKEYQSYPMGKFFVAKPTAQGELPMFRLANTRYTESMPRYLQLSKTDLLPKAAGICKKAVARMREFEYVNS